jgi:hypothetical protein
MSRSDPPDDPYEVDPYVAPSGPTDYRFVPWYRQNGFCSGVVLAHVIVMFLGGCVPLVGLFGIFTTIGVIAVCAIVLTGPVYYDKKTKDGTLKQWSAGNKVAAVILLVLFVGGYGAIIYWLYSSGKFG